MILGCGGFGNHEIKMFPSDKKEECFDCWLWHTVVTVIISCECRETIKCAISHKTVHNESHLK